MPKSLLFDNALPFSTPLGCAPGRQETRFTLRKGGRLYNFVLRDKVAIEDPYLVLVKAEAWLKIRDGKNSDTATDRAWDASQLGKWEMQLKMQMKRIDKLTSALSSKLETMRGEARNQF